MQPNILSQYLLLLIVIITIAFVLAYGLRTGLSKALSLTTDESTVKVLR